MRPADLSAVREEERRQRRLGCVRHALVWLAALGALVGMSAALWAAPAGRGGLPALVWLVFGMPLAVGLLLSAALSGSRLRRAERRPGQWLRAALGRGKGVDELARRCGLSVERLAQHQPAYVEAFLPKRTGGVRRLLVPDDATKDLQRTLLRRVFAKLRAHPAACGFERGKGIVDHAAPHVGQAVVITCDVKDFFPSIPAERIERYFRRIGWNAEVAALLTRLVTHEGGLPQGAPTSPRLSNVALFDLDVKLSNLAQRRGFVYTRYADDLAFSRGRDAPRRVRGLVQSVRRQLLACGLELHPDKTRVLRRHQRQMICGLVVNDRVNLPRKTRRELRAALHRRRIGREATYSDEQLAGWAGVLAMVARGPRRLDGESAADPSPSAV